MEYESPGHFFQYLIIYLSTPGEGAFLVQRRER